MNLYDKKLARGKYLTWIREVERLLEAAGRDVSAVLTEPMLRDGFQKHERPDYFVATVLALAAGPDPLTREG